MIKEIYGSRHIGGKITIEMFVQRFTHSVVFFVYMIIPN
jgi:hypothetical protein